MKTMSMLLCYVYKLWEHHFHTIENILFITK